LDRWARDHKRRKLEELRAARERSVKFKRILTPKFTKNVGSLRHLDWDIRGLLSDGAIRDMNDEVDARLLGASAQAPTT
jgi:hypothetical protein